ncbi:MAG: hypothetical protein ACRDKG_10320 [Actinomycetota bacterium]
MRLRVLVLVAAILVMPALSVLAQPKDPFRPPGTSSGDAPPLSDPGSPPNVQPLPDAGSPDEGLGRTGQDVGAEFAAGVGFLALGLALRLSGLAIRPGLGSGRNGLGRRPRVVDGSPFPYA